MMLEHELKVSSVSERQLRNFNINMMVFHQVSRADLKKILYTNDTNLAFEKYFTKLKGIFNELEKYGVPLYKEKLVEHLLDKIMSPNNDFRTEVKICRSSQSSKFFKASTYMFTVVAQIYPSTNHSPGRFRKRSIYDTGRG